MKSYIKTGKEETTFVIDEQGTVISESTIKHKYLVATKEQFFIGYVSLLSIIARELTGPEIKVYAWMLNKYNSGSTIGMVKGIKEEMAIDIGIKLGTIDNALSGLTAKSMIYSTGKAMYKLNPRYAYKGPTSERNKALKYMLDLECPHC